ncbi:OmpA family protein [Pseudoduganella namucuonensis]|uniref:OmpA-OmpF porin, OOP family n=1 Tax=Pseudoduganella namucuonensis TaxID=1035707 RepID=A0A1I7L9X1_9BURK|nr:OmpA family protein [Pseudoduganella namucuonensis]SFV06284.1 OmpA-OmpF porin, OOP family [Pseudoduganella namucuonensis]
MKLAKHLGALSAIGGAMLAGQTALAAEEPFVNPEWADHAWYIGAGAGQSRATIDRARLSRGLTANGATLTGFTTDEREAGYKLLLGKQLNRYFALEGAYFDLGKFGFNAATSQGGVLNGQAGFRGASLDLVGQLPLSARFSLLGRGGVNYARTSTSFSGNRLFAVTDPQPRQSKLNAKAGLGLEYKFSEALALRGEVERYRVNDAVGNRGDADLYSLSLVYKLGRPAASPVVHAPAPEPEPRMAAAAQPPVPAAAPAPAPVAVSEKVTFAAQTLFDFDQARLKPEGMAALDRLLAKMQGMNTEVVVTVGHADAIGSDEYNQALSLRRADAVKAHMAGGGVEGTRIYTEGKGESQPEADNKSAEGRAKNRRVTVEVVGTRAVTR